MFISKCLHYVVRIMLKIFGVNNYELIKKLVENQYGYVFLFLYFPCCRTFKYAKLTISCKSSNFYLISDYSILVKVKKKIFERSLENVILLRLSYNVYSCYSIKNTKRYNFLVLFLFKSSHSTFHEFNVHRANNMSSIFLFYIELYNKHDRY